MRFARRRRLRAAASGRPRRRIARRDPPQILCAAVTSQYGTTGPTRPSLTALAQPEFGAPSLPRPPTLSDTLATPPGLQEAHDGRQAEGQTEPVRAVARKAQGSAR